ncbi:unnamed protein product, partial [Ectocarpus fasciculatus]
GGILVLVPHSGHVGSLPRHYATTQHLLCDMVSPSVVAAVAVFTLFSDISLAWQTTSPRSSTNFVLPSASSFSDSFCRSSRCGSAAPFMRRRCATTQQSRRV